MEKDIENPSVATCSSLYVPTYVPRMSGKVVKVRVRNRKTFSVHKKVLQKSPFFNKALKPEWGMLRDGKAIEVPDHKASIFEIYLEWLYSHAIPGDLTIMTLCRMYVLGEEMMDTRFQNATIAALIGSCDQYEEYPSDKTINIIYDGTPPTSPARRLLVDYSVYAGDRTWVSGHDHANNRPADFINDLLETFATRNEHRIGVDPWVENPAAYFHNTK